ncbi:large-conductance mechanosensitive channel protein MscL [Tunicatimonas pelagia]|uniref:large-conductance mechanosensitive channel protein MscL n=1 Tax=Tunicatimonas pelagia TaxID=931531 RepID=UPI0026659610|nr:large-conductance mechanosensitive channel protein MscL [Tunicatimonas pelagia]WKN40817.1 large-conductance mechanosensitive channel protein MscL [Tunicatimonas pelagia]
MGLAKEFKAFIMKGNIIDLAVAVIIGAAFGKIVSSFVADVLMPPIGLLLGGVDFTDIMVVLKEGATEEETVAIRIGVFIQNVIDFIIIAFSVFMVIKAYQSTQKKEEVEPAKPPVPSNEEKLLTEIRDLLKDRPTV